eukprot:TRINITY_DN527_c0_g1_i3.p1 TRINITY_DN527_c0_g1~~TRINITY_DN527_c0_g1_i3.p1  ORF type:complete len:289 (+),score=108.74 TRINITY_DN527_c0_g1_i3:109-867(+)
MNKVLLALVFCFALLSAPFVARAEEEEVDVDVNEIEVEEDAEDDIDEAELAARYAAAYGQQQAQQGGSQQMFLTSSPDVETTYVFPEFMDQKIPAGAVVDALCGFQNTGVETFSVQYMRAFLVSPQNWNHHIQNYTTFRYNVSVPAGEESSILYRFRPDAYLEPREYGLKMEVFYVAPNNETFVSTFFNGTITVVEPRLTLTPRLLSHMLLSLPLSPSVASVFTRPSPTSAVARPLALRLLPPILLPSAQSG